MAVSIHHGCGSDGRTMQEFFRPHGLSAFALKLQNLKGPPSTTNRQSIIEGVPWLSLTGPNCSPQNFDAAYDWMLEPSTRKR